MYVGIAVAILHCSRQRLIRQPFHAVAGAERDRCRRGAAQPPEDAVEVGCLLRLSSVLRSYSIRSAVFVACRLQCRRREAEAVSAIGGAVVDAQRVVVVVVGGGGVGVVASGDNCL